MSNTVYYISVLFHVSELKFLISRCNFVNKHFQGFATLDLGYSQHVR